MIRLLPRALALALALLASSALAQVVQTYEGNGLQNLRPFTVNDHWEVRWSARGDYFSLYLHDATGGLVGVNANQSGPGSDSTYVPHGGRYYYEVNGLGAWSIEIVQLDPNAFARVTAAGHDESGLGARATRPFTVDGPWEVTWDARGDYFGLFLHDANGDLVGVSANQSGAGRGSSYQPQGGTYYFDVNALGSWTMRIERVD